MWRMCMILVSLAISANGEPCPKYGCPLAPPIHEPFIPAPPGLIPKCAKPGLTFCESLDRYPQQLIKFLIEKRGIDFDKFLRDESMENFDALRQVPDYNGNNYGYGYDYPKPKVPSQLYPQHFLPHAQAPAVHYNTPLNITNNRHVSSIRPFFSQSASISTNYHSFSYQQQGGGQQQLRPQYRPTEFFNPNQNPWPQRNPRGIDGEQQLEGYTRYQNPLLEFAVDPRNRTKRQSNANTVSICPTRTMSVLPRAAVNNQGNWMYVVNVEDKEKYSQLVRSEICMSDTCDGLCSLPLGYSSKCKQQYVQKRLIALGSNGDRLYNDVFWFPSGCMCQVTLDY